MIQFIESRLIRLRELIASISMHYKIDFVKYDGFHSHTLDAVTQKVNEELGYLLLLLECHNIELFTIRGSFLQHKVIFIFIFILVVHG